MKEVLYTVENLQELLLALFLQLSVEKNLYETEQKTILLC